MFVEAERELDSLSGGFGSKPFGLLSNRAQADLITTVQTVMDHPQFSPEERHRAWFEKAKKDGWTYGPEVDEKKKTHPEATEYENLPLKTRQVYALFQAIVLALR